jgi:hypothetical protein
MEQILARKSKWDSSQYCKKIDQLNNFRIDESSTDEKNKKAGNKKNINTLWR